jgi:hypothetical protein
MFTVENAVVEVALAVRPPAKLSHVRLFEFFWGETVGYGKKI